MYDVRGSKKRRRSGQQLFTQRKSHPKRDQMQQGAVLASMMRNALTEEAIRVVPVFTPSGKARALSLAYTYLPTFWADLGRATEQPEAVPFFHPGEPGTPAFDIANLNRDDGGFSLEPAGSWDISFNLDGSAALLRQDFGAAIAGDEDDDAD